MLRSSKKYSHFFIILRDQIFFKIWEKFIDRSLLEFAKKNSENGYEPSKVIRLGVKFN